jgi:hypothetical protein
VNIGSLPRIERTNVNNNETIGKGPSVIENIRIYIVRRRKNSATAENIKGDTFLSQYMSKRALRGYCCVFKTGNNKSTGQLRQ